MLFVVGVMVSVYDVLVLGVVFIVVLLMLMVMW